jgi:glycosyltransferase involved in cell wall biosynthesis
LKPQKNFGMLLDAFKKVAEKTNARLLILGTGQLQHELEIRIGELSLEGQAFLGGHVDDTASWYETADLFVLSSDYEGFGNVLVEALAAGLPIVSTDCPSGPAEILDNGEYGMLVPVGDADAMADAILGQLSRDHSPETLRRRVPEISGASSLESYDALFRETLSRANGNGVVTGQTTAHSVSVPSAELALEAQRTSGAKDKQ